ncbi:MAG: SUMF1/EgtB/PvdO family nonheme iron enzyme [Acidobacteria bacterium]|nr:SUMF1/EgtB/PvdO family nonheme iron enzyme [Acidobacteriota bacterium]
MACPESPTHQLWLATFLAPRSKAKVVDLPDDLPFPSWTAALRQPVDKATDKFLSDGLIEMADFETHLRSLNKDRLQEIAESLGQKTTGTKSDLMTRIIQSDGHRLVSFKEIETLYVISEKGRKCRDGFWQKNDCDYLYKLALRVITGSLTYAAGAAAAGIIGNRADAAFTESLKAWFETKPGDPKVKVDVARNSASPEIRNGRDFKERIGLGVSLEMVAIPGGSFNMGSKTFKDSQPIHRVTLKPFHMGKYQVTQAQWEAVMGNNPNHFKGDPRLPVESVSWDDAVKFCQLLSKLSGREYRLPSEAQWEYAARAGSSGDYCFGNDEDLLDQYAWYSRNSGQKTHPVGQKRPNRWGLYDVHGNVREWCEDVWHDNYNGAPADGSAWVTGENQGRRLLRGGSWYDNRDFARAVYRVNSSPRSRIYNIGFRVVCGGGPPS